MTYFLFKGYNDIENELSISNKNGSKIPAKRRICLGWDWDKK